MSLQKIQKSQPKIEPATIVEPGDYPVLELSLRRAAKLAELDVALTKKFGKGTMNLANSAVYRCVPRLSSGVFIIDMALGGGWPRGRINLCVGEFSASKTTLVLKAIADAQRRSAVTNEYLWLEPDPELRVPMKCLFVDAEGTFDPAWAARHGVDTSTLMLARPESQEETIDILCAATASGAFDLIACDSIAGLVPENEIEASAGDSTMGTSAAKKNNSMFRKLQSLLNGISKEEGNPTAPTIFFTNQVRQKIGVMWGDKTTLPGGVGQEFWSSTTVQLWSSKTEFFDTEKQLPKSVDFGFKIRKNKVSPPKIEGSFTLAVADDPASKFRMGDVLEAATVYDWAEKCEIIKRDDRGWHAFGTEFKLKKELYETWFVNKESYLLLKREILKILCPKQ